MWIEFGIPLAEIEAAPNFIQSELLSAFTQELKSKCTTAQPI
jgi:hypothetical protein